MRVSLDAIIGTKLMVAVDTADLPDDPRLDAYRRALFGLALHCMQKGISGTLWCFDSHLFNCGSFTPSDVAILTDPPFPGGNMAMGTGQLVEFYEKMRKNGNYDQMVLMTYVFVTYDFHARIGGGQRPVMILCGLDPNGFALEIMDQSGVDYLIL